MNKVNSKKPILISPQKDGYFLKKMQDAQKGQV